VKWGDQTVSASSITDNKGNTYTSAAGPTNWSGTAKRAQTFYAKNIVGGGAPITVTVTLTANSTSSFHLYQFEYANANLIAPVDVFTATTGSGVAVSAGPVTTNFANELGYAVVITDSSTVSAGPGFTTVSQYHANLVENIPTTTAGPYSATATNNVASNWFMQFVTIHQ
jgi:hypothetical protein